jgi:DHA1 family tetracycline resistance protein-like MFS transporter
MSRKIWLILAIIMVDGIIAGMIIPIFPEFTKSMPNSPFWLSLVFVLTNLTLFFSSPVLGALSDRVGRKPIFIISSIGTFFASLSFLFYAYWPFMIGRFTDGLTNGLQTVSRSALTDSSKPKDIQKVLGFSGMIVFAGFIVGPAFSGLLLYLNQWLNWNSSFLIIYASIGLCLVNILLSFYLSETVNKKNLKKTNSSHINQIIASKINPILMFKTLKTLSKEYPIISKLIIIQAFVYLTLGYYQYFITYIALGPLQMSASEIAIFFVYFSFVGITIFGLYFGFLSKFIKPEKYLKPSLFLGCLAIFAYLFVGTSLPLLYIIITFDFIVWGVAPSILEGLLAKEIPEQRRGEIQGLSSGIAALCSLITSIIFTGLAVVAVWLPFIWFGICLIAALIIALPLTFDSPKLQSQD